MRKVYVVFAAIFFGLALIFALIGLANLLFPSPVYLGQSWRTVARFTSEPDATYMLPYIAGSIMGAGITCIGILCAIIGNTFINLLIAFRRPKVIPSSTGQQNL
jgi:hypothetical protein